MTLSKCGSRTKCSKINPAEGSNRFLDIGRRLRKRLFDNEAERKEKFKSFFRRKRKHSVETDSVAASEEKHQPAKPAAPPRGKPKTIKPTVNEVHLTVDTRPVVYNVSYSEEIKVRKLGAWTRRNNLVRVHNKSFNYSYKVQFIYICYVENTIVILSMVILKIPSPYIFTILYLIQQCQLKIPS